MATTNIIDEPARKAADDLHRSQMAGMPCRIKDGIQEINPNNESEKGGTIEPTVDIIYDNAIILNKPKKPFWKRMIDRLCTCLVTQAAVAVVGAVESALEGDGDA